MHQEIVGNEPVPRVSIIIPCYNHGAYITDAVESVRAQTFGGYEIIVVNDGSTDGHTLAVLDNLACGGIRVVTTVNCGLASARNTGIREAAGEYILTLDADDRISSGYLERAVQVLDKDRKIGIVYGDTEFFGEESGRWQLPGYSLYRIPFENMIVASAFFRRSDWETVGGYRPAMRYGWEDWDFWLSVIELGRVVYKIPETVFFYRIRNSSMTRTMTYPQKLYSFMLMLCRHWRFYLKSFCRYH
jgi:glycosyltransferase involved in cell wall biosynthesis